MPEHQPELELAAARCWRHATRNQHHVHPHQQVQCSKLHAWIPNHQGLVLLHAHAHRRFVRHSPLATRHSPLATRRAVLTRAVVAEPLISVGLNSKTTGQLSTGLGALYEIQAGQFNLALSGTSGACNVTSSYTASTGLSSTYSMQQISPYNAALTFSPMWQGPVSWVASYTAISGSCDYVLMITPL